MRELTFPGFLKQYVRSLSLSGTNGIYALAEEAATRNPRLREPLFSYAFFSQKEQLLLAAVKSPELRREYADMLAHYDRAGLETALQNSDSTLPEGYAKVYRTYLSVKNKKQSDDHTKSLMHSRIVRLQHEKNVSTYRIYKDLRLNHGNMNAFIKNGDCSKVSLHVARSAVEYLERL